MNRKVQGPSAFNDYCKAVWTAFPEAKVEIKNMIASGNYVITEYVFSGTHRGAVMSEVLGREILPTQKRAELPVCEVSRYENGKVVSIHGYSDALTLIRQLGLESQFGQKLAA
jgi:predicted ester cyclase